MELGSSSEGQPSPLVIESEAKLGGIDMTRGFDLLGNEKVRWDTLRI